MIIENHILVTLTTLCFHFSDIQKKTFPFDLLATNNQPLCEDSRIRRDKQGLKHLSENSYLQSLENYFAQLEEINKFFFSSYQKVKILVN